MTIRFEAIPTEEVEAFRTGMPDAYGNAPERTTSPGGMPCRHCLGEIPAGAAMLLLAYRPFPALQPYAETGPIFLHAEECSRYAPSDVLPPMLSSPDYIVRGYDARDRIVYGTGAVTPVGEIVHYAGELLARPGIAYVHIRSARNNCFQCKMET